jgi:hypothetical protein
VSGDAVPQTDRSGDRSKRRPAARVAAVLLGCVLALGVAEIAFRLLAPSGQVATKRLLVRGDGRKLQYHCYPDDPDGAFRPVPDIEGDDWQYFEMRKELLPLPLSALPKSPWCVEYRREIEGVRGPRIRQFPAPGVARVAGVGDSFAFGEGVAFESSLFAAMQRRASARVEMVNVAESGADFALDVEQVEWAFDQLSCSRAIVVYVPNDVGLAPELEARHDAVFDLINVRTAELAGETTRPWWARASRLGAFVHDRSRMSAVTAKTLQNYRDAYDPERNGAELAVLRDRFARLARHAGGPVVLVLYPLMYELRDYPLADVHRRVAAMARAEGLAVLDLAPAFAGEDERDLWVHRLDHHPNARAHDLAAEAVVDWLRAEHPDFLPD